VTQELRELWSERDLADAGVALELDELFEPRDDLIEPGERRIYSEHELP
jgi:hypothetical protein